MTGEDKSETESSAEKKKEEEGSSPKVEERHVSLDFALPTPRPGLLFSLFFWFVLAITLYQSADHLATNIRESMAGAVHSFWSNLLFPTKAMSEAEREIVAVHEAGHVVARWFASVPLRTRIKHVTIKPQDSSRGHMEYDFVDVSSVQSSAALKADLAVLLAGRAAEELFFQDTTNGVVGDLAKANAQARMMVLNAGMGGRVGLLALYDNEDEDTRLSEALEEDIEADVQDLLNAAYEQAQVLVADHRDQVRLLADALLKQETIPMKDLGGILGPPTCP